MTTPQTNQSAAPDPMKVVLGGEPLTVALLDGTTRQVTVRFLPVAAYPEFATVLQDEARQVELFCNQEKGWAAKLHPASHDDIMEKGHTINLPFFERWAARRQAAQKSLDPGLQARMEAAARGILREIMEKQLGALAPSPSGESAPALPSPPANP